MRWSLLFPILLIMSCATVPESTRETEPGTHEVTAEKVRIPQEDPIKKAVAERLAHILERPAFARTIPSVFVMSADVGDTLFAHYADVLVRPASNQKLITSSAGLHLLGPSYTFRTILYRNGDIHEGTLFGDLILKGFGDPLFSLSDLKSIVEAIEMFGIRSVRGNILIDDSFFDDENWPTGWMWDDEPYSFAPFVSPLSINQNVIDILVERSGSGPGFRVRTDPPTGYISIDTTPTLDTETEIIDINIAPDRIKGSNHFTIKGDPRTVRLPRRFTVTVRDPAMYTGTLFAELLKARGIIDVGEVFRGLAPNDAIPIIQYNTPIDSVLKTMNKISDNLSAELTWKTIAAEVYGSPGTGSNGSRAVERALADWGILSSYMRLADGSGVSYYNLTSARTLAEILYIMYLHPLYRDPFYKSLPILGIDGTLMNRGINTPAVGRVHAKTGTLSGVSALSGYIHTYSGETLIFSILFQNFTLSPNRFRRLQDEICNILVTFDRNVLHTLGN
jgi:serine-type D-Ala-D-Ala carboxypeptidase/endopeptidase (penicillin-binding protein 4)